MSSGNHPRPKSAVSLEVLIHARVKIHNFTVEINIFTDFHQFHLVTASNLQQLFGNQQPIVAKG